MGDDPEQEERYDERYRDNSCKLVCSLVVGVDGRGTTRVFDEGRDILHRVRYVSSYVSGITYNL